MSIDEMSDRPQLKKIVFVDDDPLTNGFHQKLIANMGIAQAVEFFEKAESLLEQYTDSTLTVDYPELFIIDIGLLKESGHELAKTIRDLSGYDPEKSKIAFVTASKDINDVVIADNNEFDHYFWKPLDKRKVTQLLREALNVTI